MTQHRWQLPDGTYADMQVKMVNGEEVLTIPARRSALGNFIGIPSVASDDDPIGYLVVRHWQLPHQYAGVTPVLTWVLTL